MPFLTPCFSQHVGIPGQPVADRNFRNESVRNLNSMFVTRQLGLELGALDKRALDKSALDVGALDLWEREREQGTTSVSSAEFVAKALSSWRLCTVDLPTFP